MSEQANLGTILQPGHLVGTQYRVDRLIAKGGMAAVWAGVNEHTGKRVALKVILQSFASNGDAAELFRREALSASKVNHPNVVNIFDVIDHEGMTCIVMELFDGETLGSYLARNGPLSLEKTLAILLPAMRGVAAANAQGVVHRDLKPANIFLCTSSDGLLITTKVLDFGISVMMRRAGETAPAAELLATFGTPAYMAPEAIEFSPNIDGRADVYGFGVLLFEALTAHVPFPGPPGLELLKRILTDAPPKVTLYRPDLPSDVVNLIACALAKKPEDRFADMDHLIHATEARLLPLLPTPHSLPPISGVFPLQLAEANTRVPSPPVQPVLDKEPSGQSRLGETKVLYGLARGPAHASHGVGLTTEDTPLPPVPPTRRRLLSVRTSFRALNRRHSIGAAVVAFLIVTAWVAVPASSNDRAEGRRQSLRPSEVPASVRRPQVMPLPTPPGPAPSPDVIAEIAESAPNTTEPILRRPAPPDSKHLSRHDSTRRQPRTSNVPNRLPAPRSGRLSASDF